ncbi:MAG: TlpA family protein disulfide reductase [Betaproteobacteria bacterium]|nr:TlpA family protein disulfide reductase [Betaproteobacteria bacterium]
MKNFVLSLILLLLSQMAVAESKSPAPFVLKDMAGMTHTLAQYKGRWVLVNYWATWCPPCLEEVPDLVNLYDQHKNKDLMVLGVVFDYKNVKEVEAYMDDMLISYPVILGDDSVVEQLGAADVLPTTWIFNPQGKLLKVKRGVVTRKQIEQWMGDAAK